MQSRRRNLFADRSSSESRSKSPPKSPSKPPPKSPSKPSTIMPIAAPPPRLTHPPRLAPPHRSTSPESHRRELRRMFPSIGGVGGAAIGNVQPFQLEQTTSQSRKTTSQSRREKAQTQRATEERLAWIEQRKLQISMEDYRIEQFIRDTYIPFTKQVDKSIRSKKATTPGTHQIIDHLDRIEVTLNGYITSIEIRLRDVERIGSGLTAEVIDELRKNWNSKIEMLATMSNKVQSLSQTIRDKE